MTFLIFLNKNTFDAGINYVVSLLIACGKKIIFLLFLLDLNIPVV
jgi:hypothetical protein